MKLRFLHVILWSIMVYGCSYKLRLISPRSEERVSFCNNNYIYTFNKSDVDKMIGWNKEYLDFLNGCVNSSDSNSCTLQKINFPCTDSISSRFWEGLIFNISFFEGESNNEERLRFMVFELVRK